MPVVTPLTFTTPLLPMNRFGQEPLLVNEPLLGPPMLRSPPGGTGEPAQLAASPKFPIAPIQVESACAPLASKRFAATTQPTGITARRSIEFRLLNIVSSTQ